MTGSREINWTDGSPTSGLRTYIPGSTRQRTHEEVDTGDCGRV